MVVQYFPPTEPVPPWQGAVCTLAGQRQGQFVKRRVLHSPGRSPSEALAQVNTSRKRGRKQETNSGKHAGSEGQSAWQSVGRQLSERKAIPCNRPCGFDEGNATGLAATGPPMNLGQRSPDTGYASMQQVRPAHPGLDNRDRPALHRYHVQFGDAGTHTSQLRLNLGPSTSHDMRPTHLLGQYRVRAAIFVSTFRRAPMASTAGDRSHTCRGALLPARLRGRKANHHAPGALEVSQREAHWLCHPPPTKLNRPYHLRIVSVVPD